MDKVIMKTLELAHAMMEDDRFLKYRLAAQNNDEDGELQKLIGDFSIARMNLNAANKADEKDRLPDLQAEVQRLYGEIMSNGNMSAYAAAQEDINVMVKKINTIITGTLDGQLPEEIDLEAACGGNCEGCGGCH